MQFKRTNIPYNGRDKYTELGGGLKFKKVTKSYGTASGGFGGGGIGPLPVTPPTASTIEVGLEILNTNIAYEDITADGYVVGIPIVGFADNDNTEVWVGGLSSGQTNYSISGVCSGMSVSVVNNGTIEPKLNVTFRNTMTQMSGELLIPVTVNNRTYLEAWSATTDNWAAMTEKKEFPQRILTYSWNIKTSGGGTGLQLILTNEVALLACQSDGTPYTASTASLSCTATLYDGASPATGVTYGLTTGGAQGVSINSSTGVLTFASNFNFTGETNTMTITASIGGEQVASKQMKITKVKDGSGGGESTLIRWIVPSVYSIVKDNEDNVNPTAVTATVMMQSGSTAAVEDTGTTIFYGYAPDHLNPTITMPATGVTISNTIDYLILALRNGNVYNGAIYESQTIPLISDGSAGPAIRGPIMWKSSLARRFSNGVGPQILDREFIDIIRRNMHTYRCNTSYTQTSGMTWAQVSSAWTLDDSYNFVASEVDLAQGEMIEIRPTNAVVIENNNGDAIGTINNYGVMVGSNTYSNSTAAIMVNGTVKGNLGTFVGDVNADSFSRDGELKCKQYAPLSNCFQLDTVFVDDDYARDFSKVEETGTWQFNGIETNIPYEEFPYIIEGSIEYGQIFDGYEGWVFFSMYEDPLDVSDVGELSFAGVVTNKVTKNNSTIYLSL